MVINYSRTMIKAICFDLDGVYFTPESFKRFKQNIPKVVNDSEKIDFILHDSEELLSFKRGELSEEDYWKFAREQLGITVTNEEIFSILQESYEINPDVKNYVGKVKTAGYKTCICSNNFITRVGELDKKFSFLKDFDTAVFSYEVGVLKPDKRIFEALVKKLGVSPSELVYSDDNEEKLKGALALGIRAFVYEGFDNFKERLKAFGVNV